MYQVSLLVPMRNSNTYARLIIMITSYDSIWNNLYASKNRNLFWKKIISIPLDNLYHCFMKYIQFLPDEMRIDRISIWLYSIWIIASWTFESKLLMTDTEYQVPLRLWQQQIKHNILSFLHNAAVNQFQILNSNRNHIQKIVVILHFLTLIFRVLIFLSFTHLLLLLQFIYPQFILIQFTLIFSNILLLRNILSHFIKLN